MAVFAKRNHAFLSGGSASVPVSPKARGIPSGPGRLQARSRFPPPSFRISGAGARLQGLANARSFINEMQEFNEDPVLTD